MSDKMSFIIKGRKTSEMSRDELIEMILTLHKEKELLEAFNEANAVRASLGLSSLTHNRVFG